MTVFVDENIPRVAEIIGKSFQVQRFKGRSIGRRDLIESGCRALIVRSTTKVREELLAGTGVEFVGTATSGTDHVDVEYLKSKNIGFASAPGANANSVAEYVVYSILLWSRLIGKNVSGGKIGVIGYGNVGKIVAEYSRRLGLETLLNDPPLSDEGYEFPAEFRIATLDEIFDECEIITNHVPLTDSDPHPTLDLIDADLIRKTKYGSLLIHSSRGKVVDETALLERLRNNEIYASIDVWAGEPNFDSELAELTIHCSPHVAGYSRDGKLRGSMKMLTAFEEFFKVTLDKSEIEKNLEPYSPASPEVFLYPDFIYDKLLEYRRFDEDKTRFLKAARMSKSDKMKEFDRLRKEYPIRREFL